MVLETLPQVAALNDDEREVLAIELLESVRDRQRITHVDPEIVALLEARRAELIENPGQVRSWPEVKTSLLAKYRGH